MCISEEAFEAVNNGHHANALKKKILLHPQESKFVNHKTVAKKKKRKKK